MPPIVAPWTPKLCNRHDNQNKSQCERCKVRRPSPWLRMAVFRRTGCSPIRLSRWTEWRPRPTQPKVSYLALPRRKARKASQRHRLSSMSLQANLDAKSTRVPRSDLRKVPASVDTRRHAACATRRRALARAAPSHPSSPLRSPHSHLIFPVMKSTLVGTSDSTRSTLKRPKNVACK